MKLTAVIVLALCLVLLSSFFFFSMQMATQVLKPALEGRSGLEIASEIVNALFAMLTIMLIVYVVVLALMELPSPP